MIYSTPEFLLLFLMTAIPFFFSKSQKLRLIILLVSSLFFYAWAGVFDFIIFLLVILIAWLSAYGSVRFPKNKKGLLTVGVVIMAAHLLFWKYAPWVTGEVQKIFPGFLNGKKIFLPLPIGISFFTLQGIAYLVDIYRGNAEFIHLKEFVLFKSFFSQLVAGPIVRYRDLLAQLRSLESPRLSQFASGLSLFCMGFYKKLFIADRWCSSYVDSVFMEPSRYNSATLITAVLGYTVQIWADFSGYTDMGRGSARMLGIELPENFLSPYLSKTPSEFWRRWHITLSQWIRDYIYIPFGGNKGSVLRVFSVAMLTMAISGLWHGANWTFVLWGVYHGLLLVFERVCKITKLDVLTSKILPESIKNHVLTVAMFIAAVFGWLLFRSQSISECVLYFKKMIWMTSGESKAYTHSIYMAVVTCFIFQVFFYYDFKSNTRPVIQYVLEKLKNILQPFGFTQKGREIVFGVSTGILIALLFAAAIVLQLPGQTRAFIYFQF